MNSLNVFPIRQIYERWVSPFQEVWSSHLLGIKELAEQENTEAGTNSKKKKKELGRQTATLTCASAGHLTTIIFRRNDHGRTDSKERN